MKNIEPYDILFGVNDMWAFVCKAQENRDSSISLQNFFENTEPKRKWSLINPGSLLSCAYAYFVFGYENGILDDFPVGNKNAKKFIEEFSVTYDKYKDMTLEAKVSMIKRRLRNSIAHCHYSVEVRTNDGQITKDGDVWYRFEDGEKKDGSDRITMEISLPDFGNIIEDAGKHAYNRLKSDNAKKA